MSTWSASRAVFRREISRAVRRQQELVQPVIFFGLIVTLLVLAIGPDSSLLLSMAPASVWIAVLLAMALNLDAMFLEDYRNGIIEQLLLSPAALPALVTAKIFAHWLLMAGPLILVAIAIAVVFGAAGEVVFALGASLMLGTPILSLVGAIASALTVGLRGGAMLIALITLPLYIPTLIFGMSAVTNARLDLPIEAELYFLAGLSVMAASLAPFGVAAALKIRMS